ncbi:DNA cytosine methyltransferase [Aestuariimicrobium sp. p3-SID1156]|uniref:DNA cytosine methyltransferase n=1 Tax=Aestuariimicrobium sp. p3-SID1156 TaxID=2916038 RepID=UPI00223B449F|nr:DNA cytosine methyltransferase [Aestuariimicrobium sp. p3-SID1156]MCT1458637.1 DNA cytosine methyltransferase [Aestuariimicrobium sp. p3-SID1156]
MELTSVEVCAGAGGQALGLEQAGFSHAALVEVDAHACATLRANRPMWNVIEADLREWVPGPELERLGLDLLAGGVPCPPFSKAGKQLGHVDERDLFPTALALVRKLRPRAVMLENVRGLMDPVFSDYRAEILSELEALGYRGEWRLLNASDFGVPQLRPRAILVAMQAESASRFAWPAPGAIAAPSVGTALLDLMQAEGWQGAQEWAAKASTVAPTLVGGSKKHGGPDLGPTRARQAWAELGVEGRTIADSPPGVDHEGAPRLTVRMAARIQGFPDDWEIVGRKTNAYRQVGNAFPPPVARAVGAAIRDALLGSSPERAAFGCSHSERLPGL